MQAAWLLALLACACGVSAESLPYGARSGRSLSTVRLSPSNTASYPNASIIVALPTGCVPYSVKNSDSDAKKCPQNCLLSNFTDSTDTASSPLIIRVTKGETSQLTLHVKNEANYLTPKKSAIPDDDGFRFTTRSKRAQLLARYVVPSDARTGSSVSFVIARHHGDEVSCSMCLCQRRRKDRSTVCHRHLHRDPAKADEAEPDPKLPNPTCLVNVTWVVERARPERSESKKAAEAPDDAFGSSSSSSTGSSRSSASGSDSSNDFGSGTDSGSSSESGSKSRSPAKPAASRATSSPDGFRRRLAAAGHATQQ